MSQRVVYRYLRDSDATLNLRSLQLIPVLRASELLPRPIIMTGYAARHELSSIDREIRELEAAGVVKVVDVLSRDGHYRRLKQEGVDRGEAEAIAWAAALPIGERPLFVSVDREARAHAAKNDVRAGDLMDFLVDLIEVGALTLAESESRTAPWLDHKQQRGRPRDFTSFNDTFLKRRAAKDI